MSKRPYRILADLSMETDDLDGAASAYEALHNIDPNDESITINISNVYLEKEDFRQALKWAEKSISLDRRSGDVYAQKAKIYYEGWANFREGDSKDDKIVATLAYNYYIKAEEKGYTDNTKSNWLKENEKLVLYTNSDWHMELPKVVRSKEVKTVSKDYEWVKESLKADPRWK